ncbi:Uncharacterised protein [uncultured Ruminococcus sp.]|mgnify:FL=1|nr:Uncharacterised protein [uncultured Ruminococcus sp.]
MKYKQISIKEAADRCRNGEAVYAARCIDGMSFREVAEAMMLLVMEIPVPETETKPEKVKKTAPPNKEDHRPGEGKSTARGRMEQYEDCR